MELLNQIVIHKLWGEGFVSRHDASGFFVTFGGEEKPFSYPDSFAAFLRFADPQLQKDAEDLLAKKSRREVQGHGLLALLFVCANGQPYIRWKSAEESRKAQYRF